MKRDGSRRIAWAAAYVVSTFLSFPHPVGDRVVDGGLLFAWLGPVCLILAIRGLPIRRALVWGFLAGLAAHTAVLHWIYVVTVVYGHAPVLVGLLAPPALASYLALFPGLFAAGTVALLSRGVGGAFSLAVLWTVLDHLRAFFLTGFPWATLGYAQHENFPLLAIAPFTAVYGLSFVTVLGGVAGLQLVRTELAPSGSRRGPAAALLLVVAVHVLGGALQARNPAGRHDQVRLAVLQGNIDQGAKWNPDWADRTLAIYEGLTREAAHAGARLIVWPETSLPGSLLTDPGLERRLVALARETGAELVVGGVAIVGQGEARRFSDSAFLVNGTDGLHGRYDKTHLVPFGEYVPLRPLLGLFFSAVARGMATTDVSPGDVPRAIVLPGLLSDGSDLRAGIPICYELLFPDLVRRFVADGGSVLLAITNDAWYGRTGAPYQFLAMTALRSAETGVWTARAANTGVSAIIDHRGRVLQQTGIFERDWIVADVPLRPPPEGGTFYTRNGDVFAWGCWLALLAIVTRARRRKTS